MRAEASRSATGLAVVISVGALMRWHQFGAPLDPEHIFRQTQTLFSASWYASNGLDFGYTHLPIFGRATNVPYEFPLYQAIVGVASSRGMEIETAAALVSLVSFECGAALLWVLLRRWVGALAALIGAVLWQVLPFGLHWGTTPLIDFTSIALGLAAVVGVDTYLKSGHGLVLLWASTATWLLVLVKPTTAPTIGVLMLLSTMLDSQGGPLRVRRCAALVGAAILPSALLLAMWTRYADHVKSGSRWTAELTSDRLAAWNFGTVEQRLQLDGYMTIVQRLGDSQVGPGLWGLLLAASAGLLMGDRSTRMVATGLLVALAASPLVFFNLFVVHSYYLIAVYPVSVAILGLGLATAVHRLGTPVGQGGLALLALAVLLGSMFLTTGGAREVSAFTRSSSGQPSILRFADVSSLSPAAIITVACDRNPAIMYYAGRTGLMLRDSQRVRSREIRALPYRYILLCDHMVDPQSALPATHVARPTASPWIFRIEPRQPLGP